MRKYIKNNQEYFRFINNNKDKIKIKCIKMTRKNENKANKSLYCIIYDKMI